MGAPVEPETLEVSVVNVLLDLGADVPGFSGELVGDFVDSVARHTGAMREAVRTGSRERLGFAAHSLRGSCGIIGARRMARLCDEIEKDADADAVPAALPRIESLEVEYRAVKQALDEAVSAAKARAKTASGA